MIFFLPLSIRKMEDGVQPSPSSVWRTKASRIYSIDEVRSGHHPVLWNHQNPVLSKKTLFTLAQSKRVLMEIQNLVLVLFCITNIQFYLSTEIFTSH